MGSAGGGRGRCAWEGWEEKEQLYRQSTVQGKPKGQQLSRGAGRSAGQLLPSTFGYFGAATPTSCSARAWGGSSLEDSNVGLQRAGQHCDSSQAHTESSPPDS